jgi:regulator of protease activity HflC (stomatin/prohibitin superfamily)
MADNRDVMEKTVQDSIMASLAEEKLDGVITISQVMIRSVVPADSVVHSANELVRAKNEYKQKEVEVQTAKKEAERMAALANNSQSSIAFMNAQAQLNISEAVKAGKVQTLLIPHGMTMLGLGK